MLNIKAPEIMVKVTHKHMPKTICLESPLWESGWGHKNPECYGLRKCTTLSNRPLILWSIFHMIEKF